MDGWCSYGFPVRGCWREARVLILAARAPCVCVRARAQASATSKRAAVAAAACAFFSFLIYAEIGRSASCLARVSCVKGLKKDASTQPKSTPPTHPNVPSVFACLGSVKSVNYRFKLGELKLCARS
jgi:hypothetical protein